MSDESQQFVITEEIESVQEHAGDFAFPPGERTFLSVDGLDTTIGRYENPTSDLLRFFSIRMKRTDLGRSSCERFSHAWENMISSTLASIVRVVRSEWKKIDLLVSGPEWVLLIENKIDHWPANPFPSYEKHASLCYPGRQRYMAILSPNIETIREALINGCGWAGGSNW